MHPALGQGFGPDFKVVKGYDFVGDDFTGFETPVPDKDPMDSCGPDSGAEGIKNRSFVCYLPIQLSI